MKTLIISVLLANTILATPVNVQTCQIAFAPNTEGAVISAETVTVQGTATVPIGGHVWIFAQQKGFNGWYPQGHGEMVLDGNTWTCLVYLGQPGQTGVFNIAAAIVNTQQSAILDNWVKVSDDTKHYDAIHFPNLMPGCSAVTTWVTKQ